MPEPLTPSTGWNVVHLFCRRTGSADAAGVRAAVKAVAEGDDHQIVAFAVIGHKADIGFLALGPDLWRLRQLQTGLQQAGLEIADSYVSLTEVSDYAKDMPADMLTPRLYPRLPPDGMRAICFYPMSKRRGDPQQGQNWYTLPFDERKELMHEHGATGRTFRGRVLQLVTGSAGLDDFEWGVTLFGVHPDDLKECVYRMRYDTASAAFAEFGVFTTGVVGELDEVLAEVGLAS